MGLTIETETSKIFYEYFRWGPGKAKIINDENYEKLDMGSGVDLLWKITGYFQIFTKEVFS